MKAMRFHGVDQPLRLEDVPRPTPADHQIRLEVEACGICRTDLHIVDGDLDDPTLPVTPGHQIVGRIDAMGDAVRAGDTYAEGDRVGVPWLGSTCGTCRFCEMGRENLCDRAQFTGYDIDGGFAEYAVADAQFCFPIPGGYPALQAAPLLCAGLIGFRCWRKVLQDDHVERVGLYGFGSAAHILAQVAVDQGVDVYAFTRPGDTEGQAFARRLGATWAGGSQTRPPEPLDAAIIFAPVGDLVPASLRALRKGGRCVCGGIHMSEIPEFPYEILWGERIVESVANLTRRDGVEFMEMAPEIPVETEVTTFDLEEANAALEALRAGDFDGSGVLVV